MTPLYRKRLFVNRLNLVMSLGTMAFGMTFLLWILCAHFLLPAAAIPQPLAAMSPALRGTWIVSRVAASVLIVPIAEELAYRGYLMRRLIHEDFESVPYQSVRWFAIAATAVALAELQ